MKIYFPDGREEVFDSVEDLAAAYIEAEVTKCEYSGNIHAMSVELAERDNQATSRQQNQMMAEQAKDQMEWDKKRKQKDLNLQIAILKTKLGLLEEA